MVTGRENMILSPPRKRCWDRCRVLRIPWDGIPGCPQVEWRILSQSRTGVCRKSAGGNVHRQRRPNRGIVEIKQDRLSSRLRTAIRESRDECREEDRLQRTPPS